MKIWANARTLEFFALGATSPREHQSYAFSNMLGRNVAKSSPPPYLPPNSSAETFGVYRRKSKVIPIEPSVPDKYMMKSLKSPATGRCLSEIPAYVKRTACIKNIGNEHEVSQFGNLVVGMKCHVKYIRNGNISLPIAISPRHRLKANSNLAASNEKPTIPQIMAFRLEAPLKLKR